ncbi:MAG: DUF2889 domain-containing protein, partial [Candidatus Tectomicrobia bacterium]|nr:DUF2889 domain-containing protein [Candidatus Tectomicrobia bacterium]
IFLTLSDWQIRKADVDFVKAPYGQFCQTVKEKFPHVVGLKALPGFNKKINEVIGENHGCHHLVTSVIETMRTGRQLAIVPQSMIHLLDFQDSTKMRQLDLLLFPNIGNSCRAYNLENGSLVPGSGMTGLNASMYPIESQPAQSFERTKEIIALREDGHLKLGVHMQDNVHDVRLEVTVDTKENLIVNTTARFDRFPYYGICEEMIRLVTRLEGSRMESEIKEKIYKEIGGPRGCTHLVDFFIDLVNLYPFLKVSNGYLYNKAEPYSRKMVLSEFPSLKGTCRAFNF